GPLALGLAPRTRRGRTPAGLRREAPTQRGAGQIPRSARSGSPAASGSQRHTRRHTRPDAGTPHGSRACKPPGERCARNRLARLSPCAPAAPTAPAHAVAAEALPPQKTRAPSPASFLSRLFLLRALLMLRTFQDLRRFYPRTAAMGVGQ